MRTATLEHGVDYTFGSFTGSVWTAVKKYPFWYADKKVEKPPGVEVHPELRKVFKPYEVNISE